MLAAYCIAVPGTTQCSSTTLYNEWHRATLADSGYNGTFKCPKWLS